jgi:N-acetyl-anhydromuramyl-L-alanine amidase AmpD
MSFSRVVFVLLLLSTTVLSIRSGHAGASSRPTVQAAFQHAAAEFHVPEAVLLSVSYHMTLWEDHGGRPSTSGGYGPMHLIQVPGAQDPALHTLDRAARLLHVAPSLLKHNPAQNIRGGAALLAGDARAHGGFPHGPAGWYAAVSRYGGGGGGPSLFAADVYASIRTGVERRISSGEVVRLTAHPLVSPSLTDRSPRVRSGAGFVPECPAILACRYVPAAHRAINPANPQNFGNYDAVQRKKLGMAIRTIVIHDTEGSYASAINTFQDPAREASANYVIRSSDGQITQMVPDHDIAWHAGNYYVNMHSIGIEHEGVAVQGASWFSEQLYESSAALAGYLAAKFDVPLDRGHIVGHDGVPGETPRGQATQHWDPGPFWDWGHYMDLLHASIAAVVAPGSPIVTVDPIFSGNRPAVTACSGCAPLKAQPANFVYLHTAPNSTSPLAGDAAIGTTGTTQASDWGDKAVTGTQLVEVGQQGDWVAVDYGGKKVWIDNPRGAPVLLPAAGAFVTPVRTAIAVYGAPYPELPAYPSWIKKNRAKLTPLQYTIPGGQKYVVIDKVTADYYWSPTMAKHAFVKSPTQYYQIFFNHRFAYVKASDVQVKTFTPPPPTPTPTPSPSPSPTTSPSPTPTATPQA